MCTYTLRSLFGNLKLAADVCRCVATTRCARLLPTPPLFFYCCAFMLFRVPPPDSAHIFCVFVEADSQMFASRRLTKRSKTASYRVYRFHFSSAREEMSDARSRDLRQPSCARVRFITTLPLLRPSLSTRRPAANRLATLAARLASVARTCKRPITRTFGVVGCRGSGGGINDDEAARRRLITAVDAAVAVAAAAARACACGRSYSRARRQAP